MKYYIIAGEASGDKHGAQLAAQLLSKDVEAQFRYWGGDEMEKTIGTVPVTHIRDMAFMGFVEVIKNIFTIRRFFSVAKKDIIQYKPDAVIFIDYPGFNLRMAKWAKLQGYKTIYYISPTVWAWHRSRVYDIEKYVDILFCILPFEIDFYKNYNVNAVYCGNPIVDEVKAYIPNENFIENHQISKPILALLPGSRVQEINRLLPTMLEASAAYQHQYQIVIAKAASLDHSLYIDIIKQYSYENVLLIPNAYYDIIYHAKMALVTSGTATLETAMFGVPQVVCYKAGNITYAIAKRLVSLQYISLVNLIVQRPLVKELIQEDCTKENLQLAMEDIVQKDKSMYTPLYNHLGETGSASRIAEKILQFLSIK